jgi:hypothetical protein
MPATFNQGGRLRQRRHPHVLTPTLVCRCGAHKKQRRRGGGAFSLSLSRSAQWVMAVRVPGSHQSTQSSQLLRCGLSPQPLAADRGPLSSIGPVRGVRHCRSSITRLALVQTRTGTARHAPD